MSTSEAGTAVTKPPVSPRLRLDYLDGLRGLAALYVVMHHAYYGLMAEITLPHLLSKLTYWLYLGRSGVDIFIVLSGYCLMIPVARGDGHLPGGTGEFFKRRARRILPPYYAAMAVCLIGIATLPALGVPRTADAIWNDSLPVWSLPVILSHILLVHNFDPSWHSKIDYPMWSVATEWQIYFLFPLILLPVWRKMGSAASVITAFVVGLVPLALFFDRFSGVSSQFVGLFALGMAAADLNFTKKPKLETLREKSPWGAISLALAAMLVVVSLFHGHKDAMLAVKDIIVGAATASLLVFCTRSLTRSHARSAPGLETHLHSSAQRAPLVLRIMESKPVLALGAFSYSLYLMHAPVIAICLNYVRQTTLSPTLQLAAMLFGAVPLAVLFSFVFYLAFERPFLQKRAKQNNDRVLEQLPTSEPKPEPAAS